MKRLFLVLIVIVILIAGCDSGGDTPQSNVSFFVSEKAYALRFGDTVIYSIGASWTLEEGVENIIEYSDEDTSNIKNIVVSFMQAASSEEKSNYCVESIANDVAKDDITPQNRKNPSIVVNIFPLTENRALTEFYGQYELKGEEGILRLQRYLTLTNISGKWLIDGIRVKTCYRQPIPSDW